MLPYGASQFGWSDPTVTAIMGYGVIVFLSARSTPIGILRAQDRFGGNAFGDAIIPVVRFAGALILVATLPSMTGFLIVWGLSEFISFVVMWLMVWRRHETDHPLRKTSATPAEPPSRKEFLAFLLFTNLAYLVSVIRERLVVVMVGFFVGPAAAGVGDQRRGSLSWSFIAGKKHHLPHIGPGISRRFPDIAAAGCRDHHQSGRTWSRPPASGSR